MHCPLQLPPGLPIKYQGTSGCYVAVCSHVLGAQQMQPSSSLFPPLLPGGCFWGLELAYQRLPGVVKTSVGYTAGQVGGGDVLVCSAWLAKTTPPQLAT